VAFAEGREVSFTEVKLTIEKGYCYSGAGVSLEKEVVTAAAAFLIKSNIPITINNYNNLINTDHIS